MLLEDSLQCSKEPVSPTFPELDQSNPQTQFYLLTLRLPN
jgi:hypothetical protein